MVRTSSNRSSMSGLEAPRPRSAAGTRAALQVIPVHSATNPFPDHDQEQHIEEGNQSWRPTMDIVNAEPTHLEDRVMEDIEVNALSPESNKHLEELEVAAHTFTSRHSKFAELRESALLLRDQVSYHREHHFHLRQFVMQSIEDAMKSFSSLTNASLPEFLSVRQVHHEELEKDHERLKSHELKLHHLETALGHIEYQMQQEEENLARQAESATTAIGHLHIDKGSKDIPGMGDGEDTLAGRTEVEPHHPLLADYYDKLGEAKIINDRRVDFETEYGSARANLIFDEEHDRPVKMSVDELDESARKTRSQFEEDLNTAMAVADKARAACVNAGLDPDAYKRNLPDHFEGEPFFSADDIVPVVNVYPDSNKYSQSRERPLQSPPALTDPFDPPAVAQLTSNTRPESPLGTSDDRTRQWIHEHSALYEQAVRTQSPSREPDHSFAVESAHLPAIELESSMSTSGHRSSGPLARSV